MSSFEHTGERLPWIKSLITADIESDKKVEETKESKKFLILFNNKKCEWLL